MKYVEYTVTVPSEQAADLLVAELAERGFDSFGEFADGTIACYLPAVQEEREAIEALLAEMGYRFARVEIEDQNWNAAWESNFEPIDVEGRCYVRAPFHAPRPDYEYEIVIMPKMSFGTGHHATTHLMVGQMLRHRFDGQSGLDMGSGTGILAILAARLGAVVVDAIDIDTWAYENCVENIETNGVQGVVCPILGDAQAFAGRRYDFVLANINRNILLADLPRYAESLRPGGLLLMSGLLEIDLPVLSQAAQQRGFAVVDRRTRDGWALLECVKQ